MIKSIYFILFVFVFFSCNEEKKSDSDMAENTSEAKDVEEKAEFAIIIHGGAGTILKTNLTDEKEAAYKVKLEEA